MTSVLALDVEDKILEDAARSPAVAMMRLSLEIDRQLRMLLATLGRLNQYTGQSPLQALDLLGMSLEGSMIPSELRDAVGTFWDLRNRVVHSADPVNGYALRAIDYGLRILRLVRAIPRPSRVVLAPNVELFSDKACTILRTDVRGVILESFGPKGENHGIRLYPSRRSYRVGQSLSWEWDATVDGWGDTWYRNPLTEAQEIVYAWTESSEFVGRPLESI